MVAQRSAVGTDLSGIAAPSRSLLSYSPCSTY
jgi:hypothetical protein